MTTLTKRVVRRIEDYVVTLAPEGIYLRRQRARTTYGPLTYSHLELTLGKLHAEANRRRRKPVKRGALTTY